jgi:hypothetical protein
MAFKTVVCVCQCERPTELPATALNIRSELVGNLVCHAIGETQHRPRFEVLREVQLLIDNIPSAVIRLLRSAKHINAGFTG